MTILFRILRLFCIVAWVGGLLFFLAVTRVAFSTLPDAHTAGAIVRGSLISLHHIGFLAGAVYLVTTLALIGTQRDSHIARAVEVLIVIVMLSLTAYSHFSVMPRMEEDTKALGGNVQLAPDSAPQKAHFNRLHGVSVKVEGAVLLGGILLICLAPIPGRDDLERIQF